MKFAPFKISLLPMRFLLFFTYIFTNYYVIHFFIQPSLKFFPELAYFAISIWAFIALVWFWSYIIVCWLDAGSIEAELSRLSPQQKEEFLEKFKNNKCPKCSMPKPFRTHHCSKCNKCYAVFDHHCRIVGNCIAYRNAQPFVIFLIYGDLIFLYMAIISLFGKYFYARMSSSVAFFWFIVYISLTYALFVFCKLSYEDYSKGRTAFDRVTSQEGIKEKRNTLGSIFPRVFIPSPFVHEKNT